MKQDDLERDGQWATAVEMAVIKVTKKVKTSLDYEKAKQVIIMHETRHLIDRTEIDLKKSWPFKVTTNPVESNKRKQNYRIHEEINPRLSELRYGPIRELTLLDSLKASRNVSASTSVYEKAALWIIKRMISFISQDPEHYKIKIKKDVNISKTNQILSQLDVLLDEPHLFDSLCEKVISYHNQNLTEDIEGSLPGLQNFTEEQISAEVSPIYKIVVPAVVLGSGALALEALRRRKNKIAKEKAEADKSRQVKRKENQDRAKEERKKKK